MDVEQRSPARSRKQTNFTFDRWFREAETSFHASTLSAYRENATGEMHSSGFSVKEEIGPARRSQRNSPTFPFRTC